MTIQELANQAGVTTRTIRYYVDQGLLPPPDRGRPAEYTEEHVRRLDLIRRLKEQYLPLEEIRDTMQRLTLAQVEELVAQHEATTRPAKHPPEFDAPDSAVDYIAGILRNTATREQLKRQAPPAYTTPPPPQPPPRQPLPVAPPAPFEPPVTPLPGSPPLPAPAPGVPPAPGTPVLPGGPVPPAPSPPDWQPAPPPLPGGGRSVTPIVPFPPQIVIAPADSAYIGQAGAWQRVPLAPGIELHYQLLGDAQFNEIVARLIEVARHILEAFPGKVREES
jgi:DNA-binding transcriptional MerR regulator